MLIRQSTWLPRLDPAWLTAIGRVRFLYRAMYNGKLGTRGKFMISKFSLGIELV